MADDIEVCGNCFGHILTCPCEACASVRKPKRCQCVDGVDMSQPDPDEPCEGDFANELDYWPDDPAGEHDG